MKLCSMPLPSVLQRRRLGIETVKKSEGMTKQMTETLSELPEADASGRVAEIYGELRSLVGVPVVALIFRHLATHEGLLEQVWASVRAAMACGLIQDTAARVARDNIPADLIPPIDAHVREAIGFTGKQASAVVNAIDAYNRANAVNLLVMLTLLQRLQLQDNVSAPLQSRAWTPVVPIQGALSRMTPPADMPPHIRHIINDFGFGDRSRLDTVVPSLLRHFADTPGLLAVLHVILVPQFKDGTLRSFVDQLKGSMVREAAILAPSIAPVPALAASTSARKVIEAFTDGWIPQMTVIGFALRRALVDFR